MSQADDYNRIFSNSGLMDAPSWTPPNPLRSMLSRPEVNGLYYLRKKIVLDGYTFIGCRFDACNLEISSTNFDLINCIIDPSTVITYAPSVLKIIKLFNSRYSWTPQHFPGFVPTQNADGTITITDRMT
ncbi:MAG: hypothetical protein PHG47_07875 [Sulfuricella sp.]|nr:hypothetical protein [Sulfuricella sp.]